jgi:hypothetical protein
MEIEPVLFLGEVLQQKWTNKSTKITTKILDSPRTIGA